MSNKNAATISVNYPWAMGLLHGDVHLFELETLDKPCTMVGHKLTIFRFKVGDTSHSTISSPKLCLVVGLLWNNNSYGRSFMTLLGNL